MSYLLLWHPRVVQETDQATVYVDISVITVEEFAEFSDAATVYVDIQPGSIFIQVDFLLEIVGVTRRWELALPVRRWSHPVHTVRWLITEVKARWTLLETRRFRWKS